MTARIDKHDHLDIVLNNGRLLRYNDPRRFGAWLWTEKLDEFHLFLKTGAGTAIRGI